MDDSLHLAATGLLCMLGCHSFRNAATKGTEGSTHTASSGLRLSPLHPSPKLMGREGGIEMLFLFSSGSS